MPIYPGPERSGKILACVTGEPTGQSGITTSTVDRTGASITFTVTDRPVLVEFHDPFIYATTNSATAAVTITDEDGQAVPELIGGYWSEALTTAITSTVNCVGLITTPGTYTLKVQVSRTAGTGAVNIGLGSVGLGFYYVFRATEV